MLHWSQDYDECVFVRLLNFDFFAAEEEKRRTQNEGEIRKRFFCVVLHMIQPRIIFWEKEGERERERSLWEFKNVK